MNEDCSAFLPLLHVFFWFQKQKAEKWVCDSATEPIGERLLETLKKKYLKNLCLMASSVVSDTDKTVGELV